MRSNWRMSFVDRSGNSLRRNEFGSYFRADARSILPDRQRLTGLLGGRAQARLTRPLVQHLIGRTAVGLGDIWPLLICGDLT
jgi:hypothetical protein